MSSFFSSFFGGKQQTVDQQAPVVSTQMQPAGRTQMMIPSQAPVDGAQTETKPLRVRGGGNYCLDCLGCCLVCCAVEDICCCELEECCSMCNHDD